MRILLYPYRNYLQYILLILLPIQAIGQYASTPHRELITGEVPVSEAGNYGIAGTTYVLINDISSSHSAIFLGNNVTLDLNGYTISYADGNYEHLPNYSFEDGLIDWDFSNAPSAKIEDTRVQVFVGDKVLRLQAGEEITSQYINLPIANRSYFAMCGITNQYMGVSIYVEDELGNEVQCINQYGDVQRQGCPLINRKPNLGGGFVYAHLKGLPAGKYRIRIKAETNCLIDFIDIRPGTDVGIGIVEDVSPNCHSDYMNETYYTSSFYDYTGDHSLLTPISGIPIVEGSGTIIIKNGIIRSEALGMLSYGIQSTADNVDIILDKLKIVTGGINSIAAWMRQATITNCLFDVSNPFIINRHGSSFYGVDLRGSQASEVSFSSFYGGQGCLSIKGYSSLIHDNFFANRQTVTNHYSIMAMGDGSKIYNNIFKPEIGSGIEIYKHHNIEIYDNEFTIVAAGPSCEYGHEDYSTNAIRIADYSSSYCYGNKIYNNKFHITGKDYPEYYDFIPIATAMFYSASGSNNYIYDNEIVVEALDPDSKAETVAFYIGGGTVGGEFDNNIITTNVPGFWLGSMYGDATNTIVRNNEIIKAANATPDYKPIRLGFVNRVVKNIEFRSNISTGSDFEFDATARDHSYSVYWTLKVIYQDSSGTSIEGKDVIIKNNNGTIVFDQKTSDEGTVSAEIKEYSFSNRVITMDSPYTVNIGGKSVVVELNKNKEVTIISDFSAGSDLTNADMDKLFTYAPNPFTTNINLTFKNKERKRFITVMGFDSKIYKSIVTTDSSPILNLSSLSSGIYLLSIVEDGILYTRKIIKH